MWPILRAALEVGGIALGAMTIRKLVIIGKQVVWLRRQTGTWW